MDNRQKVKAMLMAGWNGLIMGGDMTKEEMFESLEDQISGYCDMSADELDAEMANLMGWDIDNMTDDQLDAWEDLVNETAREYMEG